MISGLVFSERADRLSIDAFRPMRSSSHSAYPSELSSTRQLAPLWGKVSKNLPNSAVAMAIPLL